MHVQPFHFRILHPLEALSKSNRVNQVSKEKEDEHSLQDTGCVQESKRMSRRKFAITARKRINDLLKTNDLTVTF